MTTGDEVATGDSRFDDIEGEDMEDDIDAALDKISAALDFTTELGDEVDNTGMQTQGRIQTQREMQTQGEMHTQQESDIYTEIWTHEGTDSHEVQQRVVFQEDRIVFEGYSEGLFLHATYTASH